VWAATTSLLGGGRFPLPFFAGFGLELRRRITEDRHLLGPWHDPHFSTIQAPSREKWKKTIYRTAVDIVRFPGGL
jgi:hypothetical protein